MDEPTSQDLILRVQKGCQEAEQGETVDLGDFSIYLEDDPPEE